METALTGAHDRESDEQVLRVAQLVHVPERGREHAVEHGETEAGVDEQGNEQLHASRTQQTDRPLYGTRTIM